MTSETMDRNKALARRWFEEAWNKGNYVVGEELIASTFILRHAGPDTPPGPEALLRTVKSGRAGFTDLHYTMHDQTAEDDRVVTHWTMTGTHTGPFWGMQPTGRSLTISGATMFVVRDGQFVDYWSFWDSASIRRQLEGT